MRDVTAECTVALDVVETSSGVQVVMDLAGVPADAVRVVLAHNTLLIMGRKNPPKCAHQRDAAFHVAERAFGRFTRAISVDGAFDAGRATASLANGELRVVLPRLDERRGGPIRIPITR